MAKYEEYKEHVEKWADILFDGKTYKIDLDDPIEVERIHRKLLLNRESAMFITEAKHSEELILAIENKKKYNKFVLKEIELCNLREELILSSLENEDMKADILNVLTTVLSPLILVCNWLKGRTNNG